ncbi:pheromone-binding protein Gp-9-like [Ooceraea biroi]|uniref:pheromone-binding protein Gp-9-like n=1 Tax=Ooceraea biroi TaxID=2015173 RepID=UPI000F0957AE|nr:pheromone-binding protein Gp-9-like [Ooceraea biroi]
MYVVDDIIREVYKQSQNQERTRKNGCVLHCLMQKEGVMDRLEFNINEMHNEFTRRTNAHPGGTAHAALDECINEAKDITRQCEKSFAFVTCFLIAKDRLDREEGPRNRQNKYENKHDVHNVPE